MRYEKKLMLSKKESDYINKMLGVTDGMGEDDTIVNTVEFDNGIEIDVKLCGCDDDYPWTEAVLFKDGMEVCFTDPHDLYFGEWDFQYRGDEYVVFIEAEKMQRSNFYASVLS